MVNYFHLQQLVTDCTRHRGNVSSVLDLVLSTYPSISTNIEVGREVSDHCLVTFDISLLQNMAESQQRRVFVYSWANYSQLRADLGLYKSNFFLSSPGPHTVNENWLDFKLCNVSSIATAKPSVLSSVCLSRASCVQNGDGYINHLRLVGRSQLILIVFKSVILVIVGHP